MGDILKTTGLDFSKTIFKGIKRIKQYKKFKRDWWDITTKYKKSTVTEYCIGEGNFKNQL